jgi:hypothetical protein
MEFAYLVAQARAGTPYPDIAKALNRHPSTTKYHIKKRGITPTTTRKTTPPRPRRPWTPHEVATLYRMVERHDYQTIAKRLDRTYKAVTAKARKLSIKWMPSKTSIAEAARLLNTTPRTVSRRLARLQLPPHKAARSHYHVTDEALDALATDLATRPPRPFPKPRP